MGVHTGWACIVVVRLLFARSPRAMWPLLGIWEKRGGGNSYCSPSCCPSYVSVMCLHRSAVVGCNVVCLWCENRNGGVTHHDWCGQWRHASLPSGQHGTSVDVPGHLQCVHSKWHASIRWWCRTATLSSLNPRNLQHWTVRGLQRGMGYIWGELWNKFRGGGGGLMLESNSVGGMPQAGVKLAGESEWWCDDLLDRSAESQLITEPGLDGHREKRSSREALERLGKMGWELVKVRNKRKRFKLAMCQNRVEFVDIWPMLNFQGVGHVTLNLECPCQLLFDSHHHLLCLSLLALGGHS